LVNPPMPVIPVVAAEKPKQPSRYFNADVRKAIIITCDHYSVGSYLNLRRSDPEAVSIPAANDDAAKMKSILEQLNFEIQELNNPNSEKVGEVIQAAITE